MILLCAGMSEYKFDRLLKILDELFDEKFLDGEEVVAQIGSTEYVPRNYKAFELIDRQAFQEYVDRAECIISHAGTGSVIPAIKQGKKIIVFPREKQYLEHCDDHQLELCDMLVRSNYALCARNKDELMTALSQVKSFVPAPFQSNNEKICKIITDFIESD